MRGACAKVALLSFNLNVLAIRFIVMQDKI